MGKHCQDVRANHPRTEPEIERFLSLPIEEIVRIFREAVQYLATHNYQPPPSTSTPSSPLSTPKRSTPVSTVIPSCPFTLSATDCKKVAAFTEEEWLSYANHLKANQMAKSLNVRTFLLHPPEMIVASIKTSII